MTYDRRSVCVVACVLMCSTVANADTIRVDFVVTGDNAVTEFSPAVDPVHGNDIARGSFSFSSDLLLRPGVLTGGQNFIEIADPDGFGADAISFSWDGIHWTRENADLFELLLLPEDGSLTSATIGTLGCFCLVEPRTHFALSRFGFAYSITELPGMLFSGRTTLFNIETEQSSPTPEPSTLLLTGTAIMLASWWCRHHRRSGSLG